MKSSIFLIRLLLLLPLILVLSSCSLIPSVQALVPPSKTFKYVNYGRLDYDHIEYRATCLALDDLSNDHFTLNFCSTTRDDGPPSFTLVMAMGDHRWPNRWVWAANWGNPVHDNATLTFGQDGNLVLTEFDGRVAWQTHTANKGVVDLKLLPNGNLVLLNEDGHFIWQSFEFPTDTLLVGQSLVPNQKLVSRLSENDDSEGPYSMVLEPKRLGFYYKSKYTSKPLLYYEISLDFDLSDKVPVQNITFKVSSESELGSGYGNVLRFELYTAIWRETDLVQPNYDSTLSYLRLRWDGNLVIYTYYGGNLAASLFSPWQQTYTALPLDSYRTLCQLPEKCGELGICEDDQCVACPTPRGLMGWSKKSCKPNKLPSCGGEKNLEKKMNGVMSYYKVVGVDHFLSLYEEGEGPMKIGECKKKCSEDCKCVAFFYRKDTSKCLITYQLNTMPKVLESESPSSHLAFIKYYASSDPSVLVEDHPSV